MRTAVLVHGAWHGPWCWASVLAGLDEVGVPAIAVELPLHDLHGDADHVRTVLDGIDGPVVLVGHSYGGAVITDAGLHPAVEHLVFIAAVAIDATESVLDRATAWPEESELGPAIRFSDDATSATVDPEQAASVFYGDCKPDDVERSIALLRPIGMPCFSQSPRAVAWRQRPSTYVVCGDDHAVPPGLQRDIASTMPDVSIVELPDASHSPFVSQPATIVELLAGVAGDP